MSRFTHLILTPFNMPMRGGPGRDPDWLTHRFALFDRFCFPSVRSQTRGAFRWLVLFDEETPKEFRSRLEGYAEWDRFVPCPIRGFEDYRGHVERSIEPGSTHLITTNLDNDDALAIDFVERVQREFREQEFELLNFRAGFRLALATGKLYARELATNPFMSLVESIDDPKTIRGCGPHDHVAEKFGEIRDVSAPRSWVQVVHGRNIAATGIWGCRRVPVATLRDRFHLGDTLPSDGESAAGIAIENLWRTAERAVIGSLGRPVVAALRRGVKRRRRSAHSTRP